MLNDLSCVQPEAANDHSAQSQPKPALLTVTLDAGACALPRLVNLMAKLDIEPRWMLTEKLAAEDALQVSIDLGGDGDALERLSLRLKAMVTVRDVTQTLFA